MTKNAIAVCVGTVCSMLFCSMPSSGQSLSGSSLSVSGTSTLNVLDVTGVADFQNNTLFFGTSGTTCALSLLYNDVTPSITVQSTRASSIWNWQRLMASGSAVTAMQLDASNRLILTGTAITNPPQIILDPNGAVSVNGSNLLTQSSADTRYFSADSGLSASNGNIGIGTTTPMAKLDVAGTLKIGNYALPDSNALFIIGNGSTSASSNALTISTSGQLNLFDPSNPSTPALVLDPLASGTSRFPGAVIIPPQGDIPMGPYTTGTGGGALFNYPQVFSTGIQVTGISTIDGQTTISGQTNVSGTLNLTNAAVVGFAGVPAGAVMSFAMQTPPSGWLKCNGDAVSRTTYAALFAAIGTTYGAGDGSTTFKLPDLRGEFVRGVDDSRGVDSGRSLGSAQGDAIRNISGGVDGAVNLMSAWGAFYIQNWANGTPAGSMGVYGYHGAQFDASRVVPTANENRPRNIALLYCIKY